MWIVFECREGQRVSWAWCWSSGSPGFDEVVFTGSDGMEPVDPPAVVRLGRFLFSVPGVALEAPAGAGEGGGEGGVAGSGV